MGRNTAEHDDTGALDRPLRNGDAGPQRPEVLRFAWASAALQFLPSLHHHWAESEDRPLRRAVMRSPELPPEVAEQLVAHRRSGMHTLGSNPAAPIALLGSNPAALQRRRSIDEVVPRGLLDVAAHPNRVALLALGSPTVDLVLAGSSDLDRRHAELLASREAPRTDPWSAALLIARFGDPVGNRVAARSGRSRMAAIERLDPLATAWITGVRPPASSFDIA